MGINHISTEDIRTQLSVFCMGRACDQCPLRCTSCDFEQSLEDNVRLMYALAYPDSLREEK